MSVVTLSLQIRTQKGLENSTCPRSQSWKVASRVWSWDSAAWVLILDLRAVRASQEQVKVELSSYSTCACGSTFYSHAHTHIHKHYIGCDLILSNASRLHNNYTMFWNLHLSLYTLDFEVHLYWCDAERSSSFFLRSVEYPINQIDHQVINSLLADI